MTGKRGDICAGLEDLKRRVASIERNIDRDGDGILEPVDALVVALKAEIDEMEKALAACSRGH